MDEKCKVITEDDLLVDLTFQGFSASLLKDFASIVNPYFNNNLNAAIVSLMEKAIKEETIALRALCVEDDG